MRFLVTLLIIGVIVFFVLQYTGFDVMGHVGHRAARTASRAVNGNDFFTTNVIAGIVSGLIVAFMTSMFSRR